MTTRGRQTAEERITQQLALFVGGGYVFYLVLSMPLIAQSWHAVHEWWTVTAVALIFGTGLTMGLLAFRTTGRPLRIAASCAAAGYVVALALWPLGWTGQVVDADTVWFQTFVGLPALAAAAAWPTWAPFVYLFGTVTAVQFVNGHVRVPGNSEVPFAEGAWTFAFCLVPLAAAATAVRSARLLDATRETSMAAAADSAAREARSAERARLDALTHDGVMTTLLMAARQGRTPAVTRQAAATLSGLATLADESAVVTVLGAPDVVARVRSAIATVDPQLAVTIERAEQPSSTYPADVAVTVAAATAEAVRNSTRHAGPDAVCTAHIHLDDAGITVEIRDDGCGFDPARVAAHRFGIAVSIRRRMSAVPGGSATVVSAPGHGTHVTLAWRQPA